MAKYNQLTHIIIGHNKYNNNNCDIHFSNEFFPKNISILLKTRPIPFNISNVNINNKIISLNPHKDNYLNQHCNGIEMQFLNAYTSINGNELNFDKNTLNYEDTKFTISEETINNGFKKIFHNLSKDIELQYEYNSLQQMEKYIFEGQNFNNLSPIFPCGGVFNPKYINYCQQLYMAFQGGKVIDRQSVTQFIDLNIADSFFIMQKPSSNDILNNHITNGNLLFSMTYQNTKFTELKLNDFLQEYESINFVYGKNNEEILVTFSQKHTSN